MTTTATITLIQINPVDNSVHVRARIQRDDQADELTPPSAEVVVDFTFAQLASVNATQGATTLDGREWARGLKKTAQKYLRQLFNGRTGPVAAAINALDANG